MPVSISTPYGGTVSVDMLYEAAAQSVSVSDGGSLSVAPALASAPSGAWANGDIFEQGSSSTTYVDTINQGSSSTTYVDTFEQGAAA